MRLPLGSEFETIEVRDVRRSALRDQDGRLRKPATVLERSVSESLLDPLRKGARCFLAIRSYARVSSLPVLPTTAHDGRSLRVFGVRDHLRLLPRVRQGSSATIRRLSAIRTAPMRSVAPSFW